MTTPERASESHTYVRYQAAHPNRRGAYSGVFAIANGLARDGSLSPEDWAWWRANNDWYNAAYTDPSSVDPDLYDREINPGATSWFKSGAAQDLLARLPGYLDLLDRHGVAWQRVETDTPGRIIYEDAVQVVAVPVTE